MSARTDVLRWARRVVARKDEPAHQILEIAADAAPDAAQEAFHRIARIAHPDLHRTTLTPDELELVTTAYARVAAAYQDLRGKRLSRPPTMPPPIEAVAPIGDSPIDQARAMTPRALLHYRKAELGLRRGDLTGAVLQLKMAIASDPRSPFLRSALAEVESELGKKT